MMNLKNSHLLIVLLFTMAILSSCDACEDSVDPCIMDENRKEITEEGSLILPTGSASVWTPDADKNCHAIMKLSIAYPKIKRVYKNDSEMLLLFEEHLDITDYINYEFGVPFGYFPAHHNVEITNVFGGEETMLFKSTVDQAARNVQHDFTQYKVEFNIRQNFQESELYQKVLKYDLTQQEFESKFESLPDINNNEVDLEDEGSYFKVYHPGFYVVNIKYTIPLIDEN
nr:hypothetical protein [Saprospiraceae bacterium]